MLLTGHIDRVYGIARGNRARFLEDNPDILPQQRNRWLKGGLKIRAETGEIYKPVSHRAKALKKFLLFLRGINGVFGSIQLRGNSVNRTIIGFQFQIA